MKFYAGIESLVSHPDPKTRNFFVFIRRYIGIIGNFLRIVSRSAVIKYKGS